MSRVRLGAVSKIHGPHPDSVWPLLAEGRAKADILARTGHVVALHNVSLEVAPGELFVVMGKSGSGKSTLLRAINRLIEPTRGMIEVDGQDVRALDPRALLKFRQRHTAMVFQNFGLLPHKSALENVAFPLTLQNLAPNHCRRRAETWLARVGLAAYGASSPAALSSGMQQRIGLARALVTEAPLLLMDEPFAALDPVTRRDMQDEVLRLQSELKKTIVMISHDPAEALRLADRVAVLHEGTLAQVGTFKELTTRPATDEVAAFVRGFGAPQLRRTANVPD
jgi:glycine betaine/proline transport system ATP-binding protein